MANSTKFLFFCRFLPANYFNIRSLCSAHGAVLSLVGAKRSFLLNSSSTLFRQNLPARDLFCSTELYVKSDTKGTSTFEHVKAAVTATSKSSNAKQIEIQVLDSNGEPFGTMARRKAEQIAKTKGLKLVVIDADSKPMPIYQLMTGQMYYVEQRKLQKTKQAEKQPSTKTVKVSATIAPHDLDTKMVRVVEWLEGGHPVKFVINYSKNEPGAEAIFNSATSATKEFATIQQAKRTDTDMFFVLLPKCALKTDSNDSADPSLQESKSFTSDKCQKPFKLEELRKMREAEIKLKQDKKELNADGA